MENKNSSHEAGLRVIVVEDNPYDAELMEMSLKASLDCSVVVLYSREMFLAELDHKLPDVIVSDSNLPVFDGFAALAIAQAKCPQVPFIVCSGRITPQFEAEALAQGAKACVDKSDLNQLALAVRKVCGE